MSGSTSRPRPKPGSQSTGAKKRAAGSGGTRAKARKDKPTRQELVRRSLRYLLIAGVVGTLLMVSVFYFAYRSTDIPDPNTAFQAQTTNVYYAGGTATIGQFATQNRESIPLAEMPQVMRDAVVAAEDRSFWTNKGIDPKGIVRAAFSNAQGNSTQGASTITQQYVKILYLTQERTLKRKVKEAFLSLKIQQQQSKSQILEGYLNTIYFGRGAYGVQAAANAFFGVPAKKLKASQAAMLAATLNSPSYLSPDGSKEAREALLRRYDYVISSMVETGALTESQGAELSGKLPKVTPRKERNLYGGQKGFMLDMVKNELLRLGFDDAEIEAGGLRVVTTFTSEAMRKAKAAVAEQRPAGLSDKNLHVATASVDVKTGGLLGFYGGQDYLQSQLNWAALGGSPGSTFKTFAVAAGLKDGFSLRDTFDGNSPYRFPGGLEFNNQGEGRGQSYGSRISLLTATEKSVNTAFIDMTQAMENGPKKIVNMATSLGIPKNAPGLDANTGVSLGSATISPIAMASAYATIANGGVRNDLHVVSKVIRASDDEVLYTAPKEGKRAISKEIAADTSFALQQVIERGTGSRNGKIGRPAAGKTGTATNDDGDVVSSWFVGFTPQVSTAVMYVRGKGVGPLQDYMPSFYGGDFPARTWAALMKRLMEGLDVEQFPKPANLDGDAPSNGHEPAPTRAPRPTPTPTPTLAPTPTPTVAQPTPTPTPTLEPTPTPTDAATCGPFPKPPCEP